MTDEWERYRRERAAAWLDSVARLGVRVETLRMEIDAERDSASGLRAVAFDGMPGGSSSGDAIPNAVIRINDRIAAYAEEMDRYLGKRAEAHHALAKMGDEFEHRALTLHYLLGKTWEECCVEMHYSYDGMMKLRRRALCDAYDVMPLEWREPMESAV